MHIAGFRTAITEAAQRFITDRGLLKDKEQLPTTRDIFGAAMTVVSIMIPGPQFAGNSKSKLMNTEAGARTRAVVLPIMSRWLEENPSDAKRVADLAVSAMRSRTKSNAEQQAARALLSRATAPAAPRSTPATHRSRRSCRCAASRSTPTRRPSTGW
jgi:DNA gyrase subunit B